VGSPGLEGEDVRHNVGMSLPGTVIDVTDQSFDVDVVAASRERPVVVDFWAAWCGPCRALGPILEEAVVRHGGVTLAKLDTDANPATAAAFGIRGIPAVKGFRDGRVAAEFVGLQPRHKVEQFLAALAPPAVRPLPENEAGLRSLLDAEPDNRPARSALGLLLIDAGDLDAAEQVLAVAPEDPVCDGLRARIELVRAGDGLLAAASRDDGSAGVVRNLIKTIRGSAEPERSRLRRVAVGIIEAERERDPAFEQLRRELAAALF
jgi:putative thioredoxin